MLLVISLCSLVILFLLIVSLITYARWNFGKLEKQGVPVVGPNHFLLGGAMLSFEKCGGLLDIENMKKYGTVFGLYEGRQAQIFVCDPELIRLITTKDSDHFDAKRSFDFGHPIFDETLDFQPLEKWKVMRSMASPVFNSSTRLKNSLPSMAAAMTDYIMDLKKQMGGNGKLENYAFNVGLYEMITDLFARSQYGMNIGKSKERFTKIIKTLMTPPATEAPWIATYSYAFPFISKFLPNTLLNTEPCDEFIQILKQVMDIRRKEKKEGGTTASGTGKDYLDHLLEWYDALPTDPDFKRANITEMTIFNLGILLFIAGQDQMSLVLGALAYHMAGNPKLEEKLQKDVDKVWEKTKGNIDHEALNEMTYLNACILEATRLYPFFVRTERVCTKDWEEPSRGLRIKKGDLVQIALWAANRNPDYFEEPEEFKPERFMPGNKDKIHPYAFTSFGFGPRNCVGKKMAIEIMMVMGAYLVRELKFRRRPDTKLKFTPAGPFMAAHEPIVLDVEARQH